MTKHIPNSAQDNSVTLSRKLIPNSARDTNVKKKSTDYIKKRCATSEHKKQSTEDIQIIVQGTNVSNNPTPSKKCPKHQRNKKFDKTHSKQCARHQRTKQSNITHTNNA